MSEARSTYEAENASAYVVQQWVPLQLFDRVNDSSSTILSIQSAGELLATIFMPVQPGSRLSRYPFHSYGCRVVYKALSRASIHQVGENLVFDILPMTIKDFDFPKRVPWVIDAAPTNWLFALLVHGVAVWWFSEIRWMSF